MAYLGLWVSYSLCMQSTNLRLDIVVGIEKSAWRQMLWPANNGRLPSQSAFKGSNRLKVAKTMLDECFRFFATVDISRKAVPGTLADYHD